ncbi:DUF997 family protein [Bacillus timonensis]|uniref:DUF997 family protein n=1 Tax=Bacillus timonensis TaxID=1033734 RepID=A0A4S3PP92_9BACI|nr:YhdT family protein [Bacillus timonensis]THE11094.1 DUF997 family protein [Bacillus timonensis]
MAKKHKFDESKEDPRFKISDREAKIGVGIALANFIWWFVFAYGLGSKDVENYSYVFGLPSWFFYSCVLGFVVFTLVIVIVVKKFLVEIPLESNDEDGGIGS